MGVVAGGRQWGSGSAALLLKMFEREGKYAYDSAAVSAVWKYVSGFVRLLTAIRLFEFIL